MLCLTILKIKNFSKYMKNFSILFSLIALSGLFGLNSLAKSNNNVAEEISSLSPSEAAAKLLKNNDANKDGKLAKNEVNLSFRMKRFKKVDKNSDNFLSLEELEESYQKTSQAKEAVPAKD